MKLSVAMIVKNEEENIERCLKSICDIVDEIVIVDTGSKDSTVSIARKYTNHIYSHEWDDNFSEARNYALEKCTGDWILSLDADEYIYEGSKKNLIDFAIKNEDSIGKIEILSKFKDGDEESYSRVYISRFFKKGILFNGSIHEQLNSDNKRINMNIKVKHSGYYETNKAHRNIKMLKNEYKKNCKNSYISYQIAKALFSEKKYKDAQEYFKQSYIYVDFKSGYYKDLIVCYINNCSNLSCFSDGVEIINKSYGYLKESSDYNFCIGVFYMNLILSDVNTYGQYIYLIEQCYLKALEIGDNDSMIIGVGSYVAAYNLGVFYETTGDIDKAIKYYTLSEKYGYIKAINRIKVLNKEVNKLEAD